MLECRIPIGPTPAAAAYAGIDCEQAMHATESGCFKQLLDLAAHSTMLYQVPLSQQESLRPKSLQAVHARAESTVDGS